MSHVQYCSLFNFIVYYVCRYQIYYIHVTQEGEWIIWIKNWVWDGVTVSLQNGCCQECICNAVQPATNHFQFLKNLRSSILSHRYVYVFGCATIYTFANNNPSLFQLHAMYVMHYNDDDDKEPNSCWFINKGDDIWCSTKIRRYPVLTHKTLAGSVHARLLPPLQNLQSHFEIKIVASCILI